MKKLKFLMFTLIAVFTIGFCFNVNAETVSNEESLNTAINNGGDVTLGEDITLTDGLVIPSDKTVVLDLGEKTITAPSGKVAITNNGTLTIKGDGNVIANNNYAVLNHGKLLTINGGSYSKVNSDASQALIVNGWYNNEESGGAYSEMVINGGTFDGGSFIVLKNDSYGIMTINNGTFATSVATNTGIQESGKSLTINGGTFNSAILVNTLASKAGEVKTLKVNGGTFNNAFIVQPHDGEGTLASELDTYFTNGVFKGELLLNLGAIEGKIPVQIKKISGITADGKLTIVGDANNKYSNIEFDRVKTGISAFRITNVKNVVIKNSDVGSRLQSGADTLELVNTKVNNYASVGDNVTATFKEGTIITETYNYQSGSNNKIIVDGAKIGTYYGGFENITVKNGTIDVVSIKKGAISLEGGSIDTITINKASSSVNITVSQNAVIGKIVNKRTDDSATITLPDDYKVDDEGNVTMSLKGATISGVNNSYVYTGKAYKPVVTLTHGGKVLIMDTDYSVGYEKNITVGTATITITGMGSYEGSKLEKTFKINKATNPMTAKAKTKKVKAKKVRKKKQKVTGAIIISNNQGTVTYKKLSGSKKLKISKKTGKITVKKGTKKGTYKIKVQVTVSGNGNYNGLTKTITVKIKVK